MENAVVKTGILHLLSKEYLFHHIHDNSRINISWYNQFQKLQFRGRGKETIFLSVQIIVNVFSAIADCTAFQKIEKYQIG